MKKLKNFFVWVVDWLAIARDESPILATVATFGIFIFVFLSLIGIAELSGLVWEPLKAPVAVALFLGAIVSMFFLFRKHRS